MKKTTFFVGVLLLMNFLVLPAEVFAGGRKDNRQEPAPPPVNDFSQSGTASQREKIKAYFFYEEICGVCHDDVDRFTALLQEKLPWAEREQYPDPGTFDLLNIFETSGRSMYERVTSEMGLDREILDTPFLILGGRVFQGYDSIGANLREAFLSATEDLYVYQRPYNPRTRKTGDHLFDDYSVNPDHVTMVYFYRITCPECAEAAPFIDGLPKTVSVNGQRPLDIIRINTRSGNNGERIAAFFDAWQVPDKDRKVPIVFFSASYLAGAEMISKGLQEHLNKVPYPWKLLKEGR